jgi:hypothetical protein
VLIELAVTRKLATGVCGEELGHGKTCRPRFGSRGTTAGRPRGGGSFPDLGAACGGPACGRAEQLVEVEGGWRAVKPAEKVDKCDERGFVDKLCRANERAILPDSARSLVVEACERVSVSSANGVHERDRS